MRHGSTLSRARRWLALLAIASGWLVPASPSARADDWVLPDSRLGVRTAPVLLLSRPDVQADLKLSTEQVLSARRTIRDLYARAAALKGKPDAEVVAARRAIDEAQRRWLDTQLDDAQRARLFQIDLQWEGPSAVITRPWLANRLGLAPEQRRSLGQAVAQLEAQRSRADGTQGTGPPDERPLARQVLSVLTPEQQQGWKDLLGRPFAVRTASVGGPTRR